MNILKLATWAATEALRVAVMGTAFIGLIVLAMLAGQSILTTGEKKSAD